MVYVVSESLPPPTLPEVARAREFPEMGSPRLQGHVVSWYWHVGSPRSRGYGVTVTWLRSRGYDHVVLSRGHAPWSRVKE